MQLKAIQKEIAAEKGIFLFAIVFAITIRVLFFLYGDGYSVNYSGTGYLWNLLSELFDNLLLSMSFNVLAVAFIVALVMVINSTFMLIRDRTFLPEAFILFLFSCHPCFLVTSPYLISLIFIIGAVYSLFSTYNSTNKASACTGIVLELALASLFVSQSLLFFPVFFIGFAMMRNFTFKSFLASLTTILFVYIPVATIHYITGSIDDLHTTFSDFGYENLSQMPLFNFDTKEWILCGIASGTIIVLSIYNYVNNYKDKLLIRIFLNYLNILLSFSLIFYITLNINGQMNIFVAFFPVSLLLTHYFALSRSRFSLVLLILFILAYSIFCYNSFL